MPVLFFQIFIINILYQKHKFSNHTWIMNTDLLMSYPRIVWCRILVCHQHINNLIGSVLLAVLTFADQALFRQSLLAYCTTLCLFEGFSLEGVGMDSLKVFWLKGQREREREKTHSICGGSSMQFSSETFISIFYVSDIFKPHKNFTVNFK